jgi:AbiTii
MTISHRANVQNQLLEPTIAVSTGLRALVVLADELHDPATAAWARQELGGHPADGPVPDYRKVTAPIYGVALQHGSLVRELLDLADLPAPYRDEISRRHAALGLHQGVAALERALQPESAYEYGPHPVLRPQLPHADELARLLPARPDGLRFTELYWMIGSDSVRGMLDAIRSTAEVKLRALPEPPPPAGIEEGRTQTRWTIRQTRWTIAGVVVTVLLGIAGLVVSHRIGSPAKTPVPAVGTPSPSSTGTPTMPRPRFSTSGAPQAPPAPASRPATR